MIYLDYGATSLPKPPEVKRAVTHALDCFANPGRGGYTASRLADGAVFRCREEAAALFDCAPEQVALTTSCTHGLNIAIRSLVRPGGAVAVSGFEHNAVMRPLYALGANITVCAQQLFCPEDTLESFETALKKGADAAIFTHVSNVFGYILPVYEMAALCRQYGVPFALDAAQSAGMLPVDMQKLGAEFIAMPGHKGLLGPQGTGLLLCGRTPIPLLQGGTGSVSNLQAMPDFLPDALEAGTLNVPGIAGLSAGIAYVLEQTPEKILERESREAKRCGIALEKLGFRVFMGAQQSGTVSFIPNMDCEEMARLFAEQGIGVRAGLHCAPLAHESAGTLDTGTVRVSFGHDAAPWQTGMLVQEAEKLTRQSQKIYE